MAQEIANKKVAVLVENGFEQVELTEPVQALKEAGAEVHIISPQQKGRGWKFTEWGDEFKVDVSLENADPNQYDALFLPGGVYNPDKLRTHQKAIDFARHFTTSGKPVGAICHGPILLIETGFLKGRNLTSYPSIKTDIINAGGQWTDKEVVVDKGFVTSRKPDDIPAFNKKLIEEIAEGKHKRELADLKTENINF